MTTSALEDPGRAPREFDREFVVKLSRVRTSTVNHHGLAAITADGKQHQEMQPGVRTYRLAGPRKVSFGV